MDFAKDYFEKLKLGLDKIDSNKIEKVVDILINAWKNNRQIFIIGNGEVQLLLLIFRVIWEREH